MAGFNILKTGTLTALASVLALSSLSAPALARQPDEDGDRRPEWSHGSGNGRGDARSSEVRRNDTSGRDATAPNERARGWRRDSTWNGRPVNREAADRAATDQTTSARPTAQGWSGGDSTVQRIGGRDQRRIQQDDPDRTNWPQRNATRRTERRDDNPQPSWRDADRRDERARTYRAPDRSSTAQSPAVRSWRSDRDSARRESWNSIDRRHDRKWGSGDYRRWDRDWRRDNRYDWRSYRNAHRHTYRLGHYSPPYRHYGYSRLSIGFMLDSLFFGSNYWISDPWQYRLPRVYGPYLWIRYYDDVLLVNTYSGEVVDVIHDFFW